MSGKEIKASEEQRAKWKAYRQKRKASGWKRPRKAKAGPTVDEISCVPKNIFGTDEAPREKSEEEEERAESGVGKEEEKENKKDDKPMSLLHATAKLLLRRKDGLNCREIIRLLAERGMWNSPNGKTPDATLYASLKGEIDAKGDESRFFKIAPGVFALRKFKE